MIHREARKEALELTRQPADQPGELLLLWDELRSNNYAVADYTAEQANAIIERTKPERFSYLAGAINQLLEVSLEKHANDPVPEIYPMIRSLHPKESPWVIASTAFRLAITNNMGAIENSDEFMKTVKATMVVGTLNPNTHIDVSIQLEGGAFTAASMIFGNLAVFPELVKHHSPDTPTHDWSPIARRSLQLPNKLAMTSINRMMVAQATLGSKLNDQVNPGLYVPHFKDGQLRSFGLGALENLPVDRDLKVHPEIDQHGPFKTVGDVPARSVPVIGCPITLLAGRLHETWNWAIDMVDAIHLWSVPTPVAEPSRQN